MKKIFVLVLLMNFLIATATSYAQVKRGVIVYYDYHKIVISTGMNYTCATMLSSGLLDSGYQVIGEFESFGSQEIYCPYNDTTFTIWIENFWFNRSQAQEWINRGY